MQVLVADRFTVKVAVETSDLATLRNGATLLPMPTLAALR